MILCLKSCHLIFRRGLPDGLPCVFPGLAADLQLVAAVPVAKWVEYITPAPYIEDLVLNVSRTIDGFYIRRLH